MLVEPGRELLGRHAGRLASSTRSTAPVSTDACFERSDARTPCLRAGPARTPSCPRTSATSATAEPWISYRELVSGDVPRLELRVVVEAHDAQARRCIPVGAGELPEVAGRAPTTDGASARAASRPPSANSDDEVPRAPWASPRRDRSCCRDRPSTTTCASGATPWVTVDPAGREAHRDRLRVLRGTATRTRPASLRPCPRGPGSASEVRQRRGDDADEWRRVRLEHDLHRVERTLRPTRWPHDHDRPADRDHRARSTRWRSRRCRGPAPCCERHLRQGRPQGGWRCRCCFR